MVDLSTDPAFFALLTGAMRGWWDRRLFRTARTPTWLYREAPFIVLAHGTDHDPNFIYANKAAQACFGYSWRSSSACRRGSRRSRPIKPSGRSSLDQVAQNGFFAGYSGVRVAKSGRRFPSRTASVWELIGGNGVRHGQAATFGDWRNV